MFLMTDLSENGRYKLIDGWSHFYRTPININEIRREAIHCCEVAYKKGNGKERMFITSDIFVVQVNKETGIGKLWMSDLGCGSGLHNIKDEIKGHYFDAATDFMEYLER